MRRLVTTVTAMICAIRYAGTARVLDLLVWRSDRQASTDSKREKVILNFIINRLMTDQLSSGSPAAALSPESSPAARIRYAPEGNPCADRACRPAVLAVHNGARLHAANTAAPYCATALYAD
jgi:hypothetical protein